MFGGCLRDLLLSRSKAVLPRDVDIVVDNTSTQELEEVFGKPPKRLTRFGGAAFDLDGLTVDIWPLQDTWAFKQGLVGPIGFDKLPSTTFLNVEAVVAEMTFEDGDRPEIYEDGFFSAIEGKNLEVNLRENPFPDTCVARALGLSAKLQYTIGKELTRYIIHRIPHTSGQLIEERQTLHYGQRLHSAQEIESWFRELTELALFSSAGYIRVPKNPEIQLYFQGGLLEIKTRGVDEKVTIHFPLEGVLRERKLKGHVLPPCELIDVWTWPVGSYCEFPRGGGIDSEFGPSRDQPRTNIRPRSRRT